MDEPRELTRAAERLIAEHVDSVGALDLLLLLHGGRDRPWGVDEICRTLRCPESWVESQLAQLILLGLLSETGVGHYVYQRDRRLGPAVDEIAHVWRRDRASVTRRIFARPPFAP